MLDAVGMSLCPTRWAWRALGAKLRATGAPCPAVWTLADIEPNADNFAMCQRECYCAVPQGFRVHDALDNL
jgi:hypothetical protein